MSAKEKPTLAGVNAKTRKRNIVIPEDPGSFSEAVVNIVCDAADALGQEADLDAKLEAAAKALDTAELEFARYGDVLFEVFFAGGRVSQGCTVDENAPKLSFSVMACAPEREAILPFFKLFQGLTRRRPFLIRGLENTLVKFSLSLEFFDDAGKLKLGIALALTFGLKIGVMPENVFAALLNDRLVAKGSVLDILCTFLKEFLSKDSLDDLVAILTKAKVANRLLDFAPPSKRNLADFHAFLKEAGLSALVDWDVERDMQLKVSELEAQLHEMLVADPPHPVAECLATAKTKKQENNIPEAEILKVIWTSIMKSINFAGKNQQQLVQTVLTKMKSHHKLLSAFTTNTKLEVALLNIVQVYCYEDSRILKAFADIVKIMYNAEIVGEDAIQLWYKKGSHAKGRAVFLKDMEPFMQWLEEAEEEED